MISQTRPSLGESSGEKEEMSLEIAIGQLWFYGEEGRNAPPRGRVGKMYRVAPRKTRSNDGRLSGKDEKICEIFGVPLAKFAGRLIIVFAPTGSARLLFSCRTGGIGRRDGFKIHCPQGRPGSTPGFGTFRLGVRAEPCFFLARRVR